MLFKKKKPALRMCPENADTLKNLPRELLTPTAVGYIRKTLISGGAIVTLKNGPDYLSLAVMAYTANGLALRYLVTLPEDRHRGYAGELLHRLLAVCDKGKPISADVNTQSDSFPFVKSILEKEGFVRRGAYTTFLAGTEGMQKNGGKENISRIRKQAARVTESGFTVVNFHEADEALLEQVRLSKTTDFHNTLDAAPLFAIPAYILKEYSFILAKDGEAVAYSIVSERSGDTAEFDQLAVREDCRSTGLALTPALFSFDEMIRRGTYQSIMWQIMDNNDDCAAMMRELLPCEKTEIPVDMFYRAPQE